MNTAHDLKYSDTIATQKWKKNSPNGIHRAVASTVKCQGSQSMAFIVEHLRGYIKSTLSPFTFILCVIPLQLCSPPLPPVTCSPCLHPMIPLLANICNSFPVLRSWRCKDVYFQSAPCEFCSENTRGKGRLPRIYRDVERPVSSKIIIIKKKHRYNPSLPSRYRRVRGVAATSTLLCYWSILGETERETESQTGYTNTRDKQERQASRCTDCLHEVVWFSPHTGDMTQQDPRHGRWDDDRTDKTCNGRDLLIITQNL